MGNTRVLHYVFIQTQCVGEWKGRCMPFGMPIVWRVPSNHSTDLFLYGAPYSKWYVHDKKINTCVIYHQQFGLCFRGMDFLFLNLRTILLLTLTAKTVFLQTAKNSSHHLQEMQTTCQAQTPSIIRSQKTSSKISSEISNFQKIRQNFWHQGYNSGIYYTTT